MISRQERALILCAAIFSFVFLLPSRSLSQQTSSGAEKALIEQIDYDIQSGRAHQALELARSGVIQYPNSAILLHFLGIAQSKQGMDDDARKSFRHAIRLDPSIPQNYYDLALLDLRAGDLAEAVPMFNSYLQVNPQNGKAHMLLGIAYRTQHKAPEAIAEFKRALALSPGLEEIHYQLGLAYQSESDLKPALAEFQKQIQLSPQFPGAYWGAGNVERSLGDLQAAERQFRKCLKLDQYSFQGHFGLGRALDGLGQLPESAKELQSAAALEPYNIDAHSALAGVYQKLGRKMDAVREKLVVDTLRSENGDYPPKSN